MNLYVNDTNVLYQKILVYSKMLILLAFIVILLFLLPKYPKPEVLKDVVSKEEREHIIREAQTTLGPSTVSSDFNVDENVRKSETAWLSLDDPIVKSVCERCLKQIDRPLVNCEKLQVLRYKPGGYYLPHQDVLKDVSNDRMYTFIVALNDDYEGGETIFPNLNTSYKLDAGDVLFFHTVDNYNMMTSKALHGGEPVKSGEKWICNLWVRKYSYN